MAAAIEHVVTDKIRAVHFRLVNPCLRAGTGIPRILRWRGGSQGQTQKFLKGQIPGSWERKLPSGVQGARS